jgi:4-amino-4-deoxychorismate lyase
VVNGELDGVLAVGDRGLAYGDGVFRTLRCQGGRVAFWGRHYAKLAADCAALGIACPDEATLLTDLSALAPRDATVKITITRGLAQRGYACDPTAPVTRIVQVSPLPAYADTLYTQGASVRLCAWPLAIQPGLAGIKHLNRLDQVMARREWQDPAIFDGLMCNTRGELVEGVISNMLLLRDGVVQTHPLADCGVAGVTREVALALAADLGWGVSLNPPTVVELRAADAVFLSNSLAGIVPVRCFEDRYWTDLVPAQRLAAAWHALAERESIDVP